MSDVEEITITTAETIRYRSDRRSLTLVIGRESRFLDLAAEIGNLGETVQQLTLEQHTSEPNWASDSAFSFLLELMHLPSLTSIHLKALDFTFTEGFPLAFVTGLLRHTSRGQDLEELVVKKCSFSPVNIAATSAANFARNLSELTRLERLDWEERPHSQPFGQASVIGNPSTLQAILALPRLEDLRVAASYRGENYLPFSLGTLNYSLVRLVGAGQCRTLSLENLQLGQQAITSLVAALTETTCLVKRFSVDVSNFDTSTVSIFLDALRGTTSLEKIVMGISYRKQWQTEGHLAKLAACLADNTTMSAVKLFNADAFAFKRKFSEESAAPFVEMLEESNHTITYLELADYNAPNHRRRHGKLAPVIAYFTLSNFSGRKKALSLLDKASKEDWIIRLLAKENPVSNLPEDWHHLEVVHYWIRSNPGLFVKTMLSKMIE